jgi:hypothetical protein
LRKEKFLEKRIRFASSAPVREESKKIAFQLEGDKSVQSFFDLQAR